MNLTIYVIKKYQNMVIILRPLIVMMYFFVLKVIASQISKNNSSYLLPIPFLHTCSNRPWRHSFLFTTSENHHALLVYLKNCYRKKQVVPSFSRAGKPYDNAVMESFFFLKKKEPYRYRYSSE